MTPANSASAWRSSLCNEHGRGQEPGESWLSHVEPWTASRSRRTMRARLRGSVVPACALALTACGGGGATAGSSGEFAGVPLLSTAASEGGRAEHLLSYRWAGHGTVPWPFDEAAGRALFGPVGRTPSTLLYL